MRRSVLCFTLLLASCANVIDLQDRKVIPDGGGVPDITQDGSTPGVRDDSGVVPIVQADGGVIAAACVKFCADAKELCTADHMVQDYSTDATCYAVCAQYSADPTLTGNTLACRQDQLNKLRAAGPLEAQTYCPGASPGGGPGPGEPASSA
ncbi:MAG: hypothetical protein JWN04_2450, partial [Myxococcaceae bacterium]|nr:hypothetical protein [Myxococcaceae bacterium]